ncbi:MAG: FAD-dependent oxidoreductase [Pseudomonadota bacterium]
MRRPRVVFLGAGHATLIALEHLGGRLDADLTLICQDAAAHYSGMVPGWIEGIYRTEEMSVGLEAFTRRLGVRFVQASATAASDGSVWCGDRRIDYDVLAINAGAVAPRDGPLHHPSVIAAKPFGGLVSGLAARMDTAASFIVVGAGPAGLEAAMALAHRRPDARVTVLERAPAILPAFPRRFAVKVTAALKANGVQLLLGAEIASVEETGLHLADGRSVESACTIAFTGAAPPPLLDAVPYALAADGFLAVDDAMISTSHSNVLAVGDVATRMRDPRPKAGVFSVRSGVPLARAVAAMVAGKRPPSVHLQRRGLVLLATGGKRAIGVRNGIVASGGWVWRLKDRFDRAFVTRFQG